MEISLCENLKRLRNQKGVKQEDVAHHLGISFQAVSKWERDDGYPDITLLPRIAAYYNVTVDELLGVEKIRQQEKIYEYCEKSKQYTYNGDRAAEFELWKEAMQEFPNDLRVICSYMRALPDDGGQYSREKIKMAERLIRESTEEDNYYFSAMQEICYVYKDLGDLKKAKEYAEKLPIYYVTQNQILMSILKGEEAVKHIQYNLMTLTDLIWLNLINLAREGDYTNSQKIHIYEYALKAFDLLTDGGELGFYYDRTHELYFRIAENYAEMKDIDNMLKNLEISRKHMIKSFRQTGGVYNSIFIDRYDFGESSPSYVKQITDWCIRSLKEETFDFCRDDERFVKFENEINALICDSVEFTSPDSEN